LTGYGYGLDVVTVESRTWTECGHGLTTDANADWTWIIHGHGLDADTSVAVLWNFRDAAGKLTGCCADWRGDCLEINRTRPDCCAGTARTLPGNCLDV
jgi:hypothetical protein